MTLYPTKVPHQQGAREPVNGAPNAALLIDFDNVTMGMRSDLAKELKTLLASDIIKGKVTVQRAYADWRRYPQYIVPLSEASIDLIFAPAYGANKKNATDIRMAIDGIELVFIRPEIGTFILLTGDSDFSSLVLKLKEYGKYVIGIGIQESSSDILVQNCDEYYSYTSISGLRKTTDAGDRQGMDPWVLVERAVEQMVQRDDVMRSDRLKQVMVELDPGFDEGEYGFSKFSRFITEAAGKGLITIRKLDNGQYEVAPGKRSGGRKAEEGREERPRTGSRSRGEDGRRGRARDEERGASRTAERTPAASEPASQPVLAAQEPLQEAYGLLRRALERMAADGREAVRDSDVKRKMLELQPDFDETNLGFSKFSRFLRQAHDHEVVDLHKQDQGNYEVSLRPGGAVPPAPERREEAASEPASEPELVAFEPVSPVAALPTTEPKESTLAALGRRFGLLLGGQRRPAEPPAPPVTPAPPAPEPPIEASPEPSAEERPSSRSAGGSRSRSERSGGARRERGDRGRARREEDESPEARAYRAERESQRRFHEAELARERAGTEEDGAAPEEDGAAPEAAPSEGGERRPRGSRGGRGRRGGRGEGRGEGRGSRSRARGSGEDRDAPPLEATGGHAGASEAVAGDLFDNLPQERAAEPSAVPEPSAAPEPPARAARRKAAEPVADGHESAAHAGTPAGPANPTADLEGLEPSRLRGRTSRRGSRR